MSKRVTRKVAKPVDYREKQVAHLCGNHAVNHMLQEEKLVWLPQKPLLINKADGKGAGAGASPRSADVQINTWQFCKQFGERLIKEQQDEYIDDEMKRLKRQLAAAPTLEDEYYKRNGGKYASDFARDLAAWKKNKAAYGGLTDAKLKAKLLKDYKKEGTAATLDDLAAGGIGCTMEGSTRGDIPWTGMREILEMLGYAYMEAAEHDWKKVVKPHIDSPKLLGLVINQGQWHFVSVPKYTTRDHCKRYVLADSLAYDSGNALACYGKRELYKAIAALPPTRLFMVFAPEGAYKAEAVMRMNKRLGRKPYTRKAKTSA